jgi:WD40 repeat protein
MSMTQLGAAHSEGISSLTFNGDGSILCSTSLDGTAALWAPATPEAPVAVLKAHEDSVNTAAFFADGFRLVTAGEDSVAYLWDARNPVAPCGTLKGLGAGVNKLVISGSLVYSASDDGVIVIHDAATGDIVDRFMVSGSSVNDMILVPGAVGGNFDVLVTATEDCAVRTWIGGPREAVKAYREMFPQADENEEGAASPDADGEDDAELDEEARQSRQQLKAAVESDEMARLIDSVDGLAAAVNHVHVRDGYLFAATATCVFGLQVDLNTGNVLREEAVAYAEHEDYVRGICTTSTGAMYTSGDDAAVVEWKPPATQAVRKLKVHDEMVMALALAPNEQVLATGCEDSTIRLWALPFTTEARH